jgi:hypothetical protein
MRLTFEFGRFGFFLNTKDWYSIAHDSLIPRVFRIRFGKRVWDTQQGWRVIQAH